MIIDFHTHIFPERIAKRTVASLAEKGGYPPHSTGDEQGLIDQMTSAGVDIAVNLPVLTKPEQFSSVTEFATKINEKRGTPPYILSFSGIHPDDEEYVEHLELLRRLGIKGIKLHPDYQGTYINDPRYVRILTKARDLGLITVTHAGYDGAFRGSEFKCTPRRIYDLLDKLGGYPRLVVAHMGSNEMYDQSLEVLAGEDVYFDTAHVLSGIGKDTFTSLVNKHGEDKILFATDSPWRDISSDLRLIRSFDLGESTTAKILGNNAAELLGL